MKYGSDYARAWARRISFRTKPDDPGDVRMKSVLMAICNYVDEDGRSWPSISTLAEDTDQSYDSVRRRLRDLSTCATIARFPRFVDDNGKINTEGRGRRTSDELRLLFETTPEQVADRMRTVKDQRAEKRRPGDDDDGHDDAADPGPQQGSGGDNVEPATGPEQGSDPSPQQGGIWPPGQGNEPSLEEDKKDSPPTPQAGGDGSAVDQPSEPASEAKQFPGFNTWPTFEAAYSDPILRQSIARQVWSALTEAERNLAIRAARGYVAWRRSQKKPPNVLNAHTFLRERDAWAEFAKLAPAEPQARIFIAEQSADFDALRVLALIRGTPPPDARFDVEQATKGIWRHGIVPLDLAALTQFAAKPIEQWGYAEKETKPFYAWSDRIHKWAGHRPEPQRIETGGEHEFTWNGKTSMLKNFVMGLRVPCLFPPRKDGTIGPELSDADAKAFLDTG